MNIPLDKNDTFSQMKISNPFICLARKPVDFIQISLKYPTGPFNIIPSLAQVMAWHRTGDKPLSEPMMV